MALSYKKSIRWRILKMYLTLHSNFGRSVPSLGFLFWSFSCCFGHAPSVSGLVGLHNCSSLLTLLLCCLRKEKEAVVVVSLEGISLYLPCHISAGRERGRELGGIIRGAETYCKKGRPAESAVFPCKKEKVWVTGWSTLFPFYIGKQLIF